MLLYQLEISGNVKEIMIGDVVNYYDKKVKIMQINSVNFKNKTLIVRGVEV